ncbi:MAG: nitrate reductase [Campylobacterota bacterium]|nr:nitrate reductase [Campylobacterota bacterium]
MKKLLIILVAQKKIYIANDAGTVDIFDLKSQKIVQQIVLNPITTKLQKLVPQNIISVDYQDGQVLLVSIGKSAYRNVWIYKNHQLRKIIDESKKLTIKEVRFTDDEKILLGTFASEMVVYDIGEQYSLYNKHISQSTLGDIVLSEDRDSVFISDESGEIQLRDVATSKLIKTFSSQNVDNVYHIAYAKGVLVTAGQDRGVAVYQEGVKDYHIKSDFLVYCVGISPSSKVGVYSSENELFSSERSRYVYYWRLDEGENR